MFSSSGTRAPGSANFPKNTDDDEDDGDRDGLSSGALAGILLGIMFLIPAILVCYSVCYSVCSLVAKWKEKIQERPELRNWRLAVSNPAFTVPVPGPASATPYNPYYHDNQSGDFNDSY